MRLAFADLVFSWPPNGGADIDLCNVVSELERAGMETCLFVAHEQDSCERGRVDPEFLPFPCMRLDFTRRTLRPEALGKAFCDAVDAWRPDMVFLMHGFTLKPHLALALRHHRLVARYYAHELACARDPFRFKDGAPCPKDFLRTPEDCRRCALESQKRNIQRQDYRTWTADYLAARAYAPEYHALLLESLKSIRAVIVSNPGLKAELEGFHNDVSVIPGGVHVDQIPLTAMTPKRREDRKIIYMPGRVEDPLKGLPVLWEAVRLLERDRNDFEVWTTHFDHSLSRENFKAIGWRDHAAALALYGKADICVVPSVWEEPFGLTAVEAMAAARPVCASRTGGLAEIVRHEETGFLFKRGSTEELAQRLRLLLDDGALRARMGEAGRRRVEEHYGWRSIIERHYLPLIERLVS